MDAEQIAFALDPDARETSTGWSVRCPCHDDRHASLSLSDDDRGDKVLWFCHAGCGQQAILDELKRRGLLDKPNGADRTGRAQWHPLLPVPADAPAATFRHANHGQPCATWTYRDAERRVLFHVARFDLPDGAKLILPRCYGWLDGARAWHWRAAPAPRPLYGLARLAKRPEAPVLIVEGEKVAAAARKLVRDHVVVTWPGGAEAPAKADWTALKGRKVVLWPDADAPGQKAARAIATLLQGIAAEVRIVDLPADLPAGWDLADPVPAELDIQALLEGAPRERPTDAWTMREFVQREIPPLSYLISPILVMPGMTMLHARAGHGKTRLALSLAYATATDAPLMDWTVEKPATVLYVDAELSPQNMQAWLKRLGRSKSRLHILSDKLNYYDGKPRVSLATEADRAYLSRAIARLDPQLIVLDSLFTLVPPAIIQGAVHEDSWSAVIDWMRELKREGRHVLLLHHDSKEGSQYGASIKEIEFDLMMQLRVRSDYSGNGKWAFELSFTKPRHLSAEDAKPRIITATDDGMIDWERTELSLQKPRERDAEAQQLRAEIMELTEQGLSVREIAEQVGRSERWVKKVRSEVRSEERGADDDDGEALV